MSKIAGTTRDTIEESAVIQGIPFQLVDTAGILVPRDLIEEEAVKRSKMSIKSADLILLVMDGSQAMTGEDRTLIDNIKGQNVLIVINKMDLTPKINEDQIHQWLPGKPVIKISALQKKRIVELEKTMVESVLPDGRVDSQGILISNMRHVEALKNCQEALNEANKALTQNLAFECVSEKIKEAVNELDKITGRHIEVDLLDQIFSQFCIGK